VTSSGDSPTWSHNNHCEQEERDTDQRRAVETVPHGLDPLSAQHAEYNHKRVKKVDEIPTRFLRKMLGCVIDAEQLLSHDGEDEDDDG